MAGSAVAAFILVALAELGDKTQLLTLVLASRHGVRSVVLGVGAAIVVLQTAAVAFGATLGSLIPQGVLPWIAGMTFIAFGVWTLAGSSEEGEGGVAPAARVVGSGVATAFGAFLLAELGDKTQLMTAALAADPVRVTAGAVTRGATGAGAWVGVLLGSVLAMFAVNGLAALAGSALGARLAPRRVARFAGLIFLAVGVATLWMAWRGGSP